MSEYGSYDSDNGSGFWAPPEKCDYEVFKSGQPDESEFSDSYQDTSSEIEDVECEKEAEIKTVDVKKNYQKNKNGRIKNDKGDEGKPFYVPRKPHFFEHDIRILDDEEEIKEKTEKTIKRTVDSHCWKHDLFNEDEQQPKSEVELIDTYGYDIRSDSPTSIGKKIFKQRRSKNKKNGKSHNYQNECSKAYIDMEPIKQQNNFLNQPAEIQRKGFRGRTSLRKAPCERNPVDVSCDVDIHQFEKLTISNSDFNDKNHCAKHQDFQIAAIPTAFKRSNRRDPSPHIQHQDFQMAAIPTAFMRSSIRDTSPHIQHQDFQMAAIPTAFMRSSKRDPSPKHVVLDDEKSSLKYVVHPRTMTYSHIQNSFQNYRETDMPSHNTDDGYVFSTDAPMENKTRMMPSSYESIVQNIRSNGEGCRRAQCSMPDLERSYETLDNFTSINNVLPTYVEELYKMGNRENFEFPDPPDLSATHLMPCSPYPQYFFHPFYQQSLGSLMKWEFFGQPYYPTSSIGRVAFVKQEQLGSWANPHHQCQSMTHQSNVMPSPRHVGASPYYTLLDYANVVRDDSSIKCGSSADVTDQSPTVPSHHTSHRYSQLRTLWRRKDFTKMPSGNANNIN